MIIIEKGNNKLGYIIGADMGAFNDNVLIIFHHILQNICLGTN